MTMDVEQLLRRTLDEVGSRVEVPVHQPLGPGSSVGKGFSWPTMVAAASLLVCLGFVAFLVFGDGDPEQTVNAGPGSVSAEAVVEYEGFEFRAVAASDGDGLVCLRVELPAAVTPMAPAEPVCVEGGEPEALAVGTVTLEHPLATVVYALGGPGVASMQAAIDQVAVGHGANVATDDVAVFLLLVEVPGASGIVSALDSGTGPITAAPFGASELCVGNGDPTIRVPAVIGMPLPDAVSEIEGSGLAVVSMGTWGGDPSGHNAVVIAQKPAPGVLVPRGACVGFRTEE